MRKHMAMLVKLLLLPLFFGLCGLFTPSAETAGLHYELAIFPQFEKVSAFGEGLAPVKKDGKWGYIDESGALAIGYLYDYAYRFENGLAVVITAGEKKDESTRFNYGFVNHSGVYTPFLLPGFDETGAPGPEEQAHIFYEGTDYDEIFSSFLPFFTYGYIRLPCNLAQDTQRVVLFGSDGRPAEAFYSRFSAELSLKSFNAEPIDYVGENGYLPYLINREGKSLAYLSLTNPNQAEIRPVFPKGHSLLATSPFNQGHSVIFLQNAAGLPLAGIIYAQGEWISPQLYSRIWKQLFSGETFFEGRGLASVQTTDGLAGAIDKNGKTVIPFVYEELLPFQEGLAAFRQNGKVGFLDPAGETVISAEFDDTTGFENGYALVRRGEKSFLIDREGNPLSGSENIDFGSYLIPREDGSALIVKPDSLLVVKAGELYGFGKISFSPAPPKEGETAVWAYEEVCSAIENKLIPAALQNQYLQPASREDFGVLAISLLEQVSGKDMEALLLEQGKALYEQVAASPFTDTQKPELVAAQALGLIQGQGQGRFAPYAPISRQDAAVMLMRLAQYLGLSGGKAPLAFTDSADISAYACEAVDFVSSLGLMKGVGEGYFAPLESYTRQQASMTMNRLFQLQKEA